MGKLSDILALARETITDEDYERAQRLLCGANYPTAAELGHDLDDFLGYDPIHFHTLQFLQDDLASILAVAPPDVKTALAGQTESIITSVISHKENIDEEYLHQILSAEILARTDWDISEIGDEYRHPEMTSVIYGEIVGEIMTDEDEEDDDDPVDEVDDESGEDDALEEEDSPPWEEE